MSKQSSLVMGLCLCLCVLPHSAISKTWQASDGTKLVKFDEELYLLSYNTFLANKNLNDALVVARAAVAQNPHSLAWRKRLIEVARWANHPRLAFGVAYQSALEDKSVESIDIAISLAQSLNEISAQERLLKLKIQQVPNDAKSIARLIQVEELLGKPERSIELLEKHHTLLPNVDYLNELARLHKGLGQADQEVKIIHEMTEKGDNNPNLLLREVEILSTKGDFETALKKLIQAESTHQQDQEYWLAVANTAWRVNDTETALKAYKKIFAFGQSDTQSDARLIQLLGETNPELVYQISKQAWLKVKDPAYFFTLLSSGATLKKWHELNGLYHQIPNDQKHILEEQAYYWEMRAYVADQAGDHTTAYKNYQEALAKYPNDQSIRLSYAWFLLAHNNTEVLQTLLFRWQHDFTQNPAFSGLFTGILQQLGLTALAIEHMTHDYAKKNHSVVWLNNFAQLLDTIETHPFSHLLRLRAWQLQRSLPHHGTPELHRAIAELAMQLDPADSAVKAISLTKNDVGYRELLMGWSLGQDAPDVAHFVRDRMPSTKDPIPPWANLTLSLQDYDKDNLYQLLQLKPELLPYRDAVNAEEAIRDLPAAEEWAYTSLEQHPTDGLLYAQAVGLMEDHANKASLNFDYATRGGVAGFYPQAKLRYFVEPRNALLVESDRWNLKSLHTDNTIDLQVPSRYWRNAVGLMHLVERGFVQWMVANQRAFNRYYTWTMDSVLKVTDRLTLLTHFGKNDKAFDTTQLEIAGMKDTAQFQGFYQFNRNQQLVTELSFNWLRDQDRALLAHNNHAYIAFEQKLRDTYPDFSVRLYASRDQYHPVRTLPRFLTTVSLDPSITIQSIVPQNFYEYGVSFQWGEEYRTRYTKPWHPFAVTSLFKNSVSGFGYYGVAGVAGKMLGHDHLAIYYERSKGQRSLAQTNELVGISYSRYF